MASLECEYTDNKGHKSRKQKKLKEGAETNRYEEAEKPITVKDLQDTLPSPLIQDPESVDIEIAEEENSSQNAVTDETDINQETGETSEVQNLKETLPSHVNQEIESECTDIEVPQISVTDDADVNQNLEAPKPLVEQDIKENILQLRIANRTEPNCEYIDIDESNNHSQIAMAAEANLVRKREVVKPTTERVVKEALPGRAKRESLEYTDIERPKNRTRNTVTAEEDLNRYKDPKTTIEHDEKESHVKEDEQEEFFDVQGFEFYEPNAGKSSIHLNRFQEAKKSPTLQVVTENVPNRFLKEGNRAKSSAESKPDQSSMPGKSNTHKFVQDSVPMFLSIEKD
ncbi:hypothetical protein JTE90_008567 [Oedothorax gibbosus]|uniref:Uncharacterized protein n=1 Tax=Oedothorax gibbosus TaxID=931172 RepID=A0AAV6TSA8_9ARAC|nr:hypothetical protein JTE90_008567 [Oedothorax gibbosus]